MTNYAIELNQVTKRFGKQTAVDQIDLAVPEGAVRLWVVMTRPAHTN